MSDFEPLTSTVRPATDALVTVRIVKSFPYRNVKNHIVRDLDLKSTTPRQLVDQVLQAINTLGAFRPYRTVAYDTLKIYTRAHGSKSMNLVINLDNDDWVLYCGDEANHVDKDQPLWDLGVENETELSLFKWLDYVEFKQNPEEKW